MKAFSCKVRVLLIFVLSLFSSLGFSQVDKEFWFSVPYVNKNHTVDKQRLANQSLVGGQPIYLRLTTLDNPAIVTVTTPRNPSLLNITVSIPANSTSTVDLSAYVDQLEVSQTYSTILSGPEDKGLHIVSTDLISAYYENATVPNPEIFTLKGKNALGTEFYTPFQTVWPNDPLHNYRIVNLDYDDNSKDIPQGPDSAFSAFDIVATRNGTVVTITPATDVVGHKKGETFNVVLDEGQTYSVRQLDQAIDSLAGYYKNKWGIWVYKDVTSKRADDNLSGSHITSNYPIAVSVKDDSIFPNDITESGDCEDFVGDQLIPVNVIGKEYIVMKGNLDAIRNNVPLTDWVFIVGVQDGTNFKLTNPDGTSASLSINKGETQSYQVTQGYLHILAQDTSLYVFHISGYNCEFASAILPPIDLCTGSDQVGFTRTYGRTTLEHFFANILVRVEAIDKSSEKSFVSDETDPANINKIASIINNATFIPLPGNSNWAYTQIEFNNIDLTVGSHILKNTKAYFHFSMINSTIYNWDAVYNDWPTSSANQVQGSSYGYFSSYNVSEPRAIIGNNSKKVIQVPQGFSVQLVGTGGLNYDWKGNQMNSTTGLYSIPLKSPYYLDKVSGYNPIFNGTAPVGKYQYIATIVPACANIYIDTVYIEVIPPIAFHDVTDSICEDTPGSALGVGYNLNNLNDTIIGVRAKTLGYTVSNWFVKKPAGTQILDDAESNVKVTYTNPVYSIFTEKVANTLTSGLNTSLYCNKITNSINGTSQPIYSINVNLPQTVNLSSGVTFNMLVRPDISLNPGWLTGVTPITVVMTLTNATNTNTVTASQTFTSADWKGSLWEQMIFNYASSANGTVYDRLTLTFGTTGLWAPMNFFMDNLNWFLPAHTETITNPTNITIHDNDTVFAHITNPQFPFFSDTAQAIIGVHPTGKAAIDVTLPSMCATNGNTLECVDLTQYKYAVGGALVAQKDWYLDAARTQKIAKPTCVNVSGTMKYYAKINDSCGHVGTVLFNIIPVPTINDSVATVCADPNSAGNSATGIKLDNYTKYVLPLGGSPTIEWYTNAALTPASQVSGANGITVTNNQTLYARIYNNLTCVLVAQLKFVVNPISSIAITAKDLCLNGANLTLSATPVGGTFTGTGVSGYTFNPSTAGIGRHAITYTYQTTANGLTCISIKNDTIEVFAVPTATVTANPVSPIDYNSTTQLNAAVTGGAPTYTYVWSPSTMLSKANIQNPTTTTLTVVQQYCVTVTDKNACADTKCIVVDVKNAPLSISITPSANNICLGNTVNLNSLVGGGTPGYTYNWSSLPAGLTSAAKNSTHIPTAVGNITYYVTVTDNVGATATNSVVVTVNSNPVVTFANPIENICQNGSLTLAPTITGTNGSTLYTWAGSPVALAPLNGQTLVIDATQAPGSYPVSLTVLNTGGCTVTSNVTVKINENPKATVTDINGACLGIGTKLNAIPTGGTTPYTHLWTGNYNVGDLLNPTDEDPTFKSNTFGVYNLTYTVTDANNCKVSASMKAFDLNSLPEPNILNAYRDSVCQNTNSYLLQAEVLNPKYSLNSYTYHWKGKEGSTDYSSTLQNPILNITDAKTFNLKLEVTDKNGCSALDSTILRVNPNPTATIVGDATVCEGLDLPLESFEKSNAYSYSWIGNVTPKNTASVVFNGATSSTYNVSLEVKDKITACVAYDAKTINVKPNPTVSIPPTTLCYKSSITLFPNVSAGVTSYNWTFDYVALNSRLIKNPTFNAAENRNYKLGLEVSQNGCTASTIMDITVNPLPTINAGNDTNVLYSMPFTLNGSSSGIAPLTYQWTPTSFITSASTILKPTAAIQELQKFIVTVTDGNGCKAVDSVNVNVPNGKPEVTVLPQTICGTQNVTLTAIPKGGTGNGLQTFTWYTLTGTTSIGTGAVLTVSVSQQTDYRVVMVDATYPPVSDTVRVSFNTPPTINLTPLEPLSVCIGETMAINATSPQANVGFTWQDGLISTKTNPFLFTKSTVPVPTDIFVIGIDTVTKCSTQKKLTITVNALPTVTVAPTNPSLCAGKSITLTATSKPTTVDYAWTEGTNSSTIGTSSNYIFSRSIAGPFTMKVQVTDINTGCKASAQEIVTVNALPNFKLPSEVIVCTNQSDTLDLNPNNAPGTLNVTWSGDIQYLDLTDKTAPIFYTTVANPAGYKIKYTINDGKVCDRIDSIIVKVQSAPVVTLRDTVICQQESVLLQANIIGNNPTVIWDGFVEVDPNNKSVANYTANVIPGTYVVKVTASSNSYCSSKAIATVTVRENPVSIINAGYPTIPKGGQIDLIGKPDPTKGTPPYTGKWLTSDIVESTQAGSNGFIAKSMALVSKNTFYLVTIDKYGCRGITPTTVTVDNGIEFKIAGDPTNKPNDPNNPITPSDYPANTLNYRGLADICEGESYSIVTEIVTKGSGDYSYKWTTNNSTFTATTANIKVMPPAFPNVTKYKLEITDNKYPTAIIDPLYFTITVHRKPSVTIISDNTTMLYETIPVNLTGRTTFYDGATAVTSLWSGSRISPLNKPITTFTPAVKGDYKFDYTVTDNYGCVGSATTSLHILPMGTITLSVPDQIDVCGDGTYQEYKVTNGDNGNYYWTSNDPDVKILTPNPGSDAIISWTKPGTFIITINDVSGGITSSPKPPKELVVNVYPTISLSDAIVGPQDVCEYDSVEYKLNPSVIDAKTTKVSWDIASDLALHTQKIVGTSISDKIDVKWGKWDTVWQHDYIIINAFNDGHCSDQYKYPVTIHKVPTPNFVARPLDSVKVKEIYSNKLVDFDNRSYLYGPWQIDNASRNLQYYWDFVGDGVFVQNIYEPQYSYDEKGTYNVSLTAVDPAWGCRATITKPVVVIQNPNCGIKYPNAFTPESKSDNKFSYGYCEGIVDKDYNLKIFNRWGQLLWETNSRSEKWDGTYKGEVCKQDVYVFHSTATCENGSVIKTNGDVTLIK